MLFLLFLLLRQISRSNQIRIEFHTENLEHGPFEPGLLKVVAIDTSAGLVPLNPGDGGVVVGMVSPYQDRYDITVEDNESLHIYQSTEQFQITGSGFEDNTMVSNGCVRGYYSIVVRSLECVFGANVALRAN